ncbi:MAG: response regulator, partial [Bacteroidota bacterium]
MKKFYVLLLAVPVLIVTILYLSIWWFLVAVAMIFLIAAYQFYSSRLDGMQTKNEILSEQIEALHLQLDHSIVKEQKAAKEAESVRNLKQQLLTVMSHEIRTPMNGVMGMTLLLSDTPLNDEQKEYVKIIRNSGEGLLSTVNDILANDALDFSKIDREENKLEYKEFELRNTIEETLDIFSTKAAEAGIDLLYEIDANMPAQLIGDNKRVRQVLLNLVENAVKFTSVGEVFVAAHFINNKNGSNPELCIEVHDTGTGISKDQLKQLFKGIPGREFQRSSEQPASGLGLVICRKLVELMGGTIKAESQLGQGSVITFIIPVIPSLKETRQQVHHDRMRVFEGKHILVVDDNSRSRSLLMKQLQSWKTLPIGAESGTQAIDILSRGQKIDLVITDLNLPAMSGIELSKAIKHTYAQMPIILMNPAGSELYKEQTDLITFILPKPVRQSLLQDHLLGVFAQTVSTKPISATQMTDDFAKLYPLRIMIAEDNLINQKIAIKILNKLGYQPALANNGKEVMEMVANEHYDLILMDVQMPEMDGLEATKMIRTCLEIQPIIMAMTANVLQGDRDACIQAGMDDYISKPIDLKELISHLEKWALAIKEKK